MLVFVSLNYEALLVQCISTWDHDDLFMVGTWAYVPMCHIVSLIGLSPTCKSHEVIFTDENFPRVSYPIECLCRFLEVSYEGF